MRTTHLTIASVVTRFHFLLIVLALCVLARPLQAHTSSDSFLILDARADALSGEWHLALRDLNDVLGLDLDSNGQITWRELRQNQSRVISYALARLEMRTGSSLAHLSATGFLVDNHSDGAYAVIRFQSGPIPGPGPLVIRYAAFFDRDRLHRGLLRLDTPQGVRTAVFGPETATQQFPLMTGGKSSLPAFVNQGVWHIWTGYDHILFLLALLLPGALRWESGQWRAQPSLRTISGEVLSVVTAFTVAHSPTLSLAALGYVCLSPRLIEPAIALSVVFAAANNLRPLLKARAWIIAFAFGLVHGFGFANAVVDLGLRGMDLAQALFGFNVGVELGQLAIVSVCVPILCVLRGRAFYRERCLPAASGAIGLVAVAWLAERALDVKWLPF